MIFRNLELNITPLYRNNNFNAMIRFKLLREKLDSVGGCPWLRMVARVGFTYCDGRASADEPNPMPR